MGSLESVLSIVASLIGIVAGVTGVVMSGRQKTMEATAASESAPAVTRPPTDGTALPRYVPRQKSSAAVRLNRNLMLSFVPVVLLLFPWAPPGAYQTFSGIPALIGVAYAFRAKYLHGGAAWTKQFAHWSFRAAGGVRR